MRSIAARAIIIKDDKILVMRRNKHGSEYYTLVGGTVTEGESLENALVREVKEETGLTITSGRPVFAEKHHAPHNDQYIFLCEVEQDKEAALQRNSEEAMMNRMGIDMHTLMWVDTKSFHKLPFNTMQLQKAIVNSLQTGFPETMITL